jgi:CDP-glycerol glycerophosphotransferase (TagB/SpsB family)
VFRELLKKHRVDQRKLRLVGNPLHDRLISLDRNKIISRIEERFPGFKDETLGKSIIILATCLHYEYKDFENEEEMYKQFLQHIYQSLDFSRMSLIIKRHPEDLGEPNLYAQLVPGHAAKSIRIVDAAAPELDVYSLLHIADLLITRASTVAEEALLMGKKVVAFDLIKSGPAQNYKHLESYGFYRTVHASPPGALKEAVSVALFSDHDCRSDFAISDFTYLLDGKSTDRAASEIISQLVG